MKIKISLIFLKETLQDFKYDDKVFSHLSLELADRILSSVKEFGYHRYKFIIKVLFIQKTGQAINVSTSAWEHGGKTWSQGRLPPTGQSPGSQGGEKSATPTCTLRDGQAAPWGGLEKGRSSSDA